VTELLERSAREIALAIQAREVSALEVLEQHLERVAELNPRLNAIVTLDEEGARAAAARADAALAAGESVGPLHGLPFVVKDLLATEGLRSTAGSRLLSDFVPRRSATAVERLSRAGAVLMGKTNCAELGLDVHTSNELFGATLNPIDERVTPGGSSGGDSAAVAAGLAAFAIGTDYGGSIRWPSQCTGLASLRPTPGVVPSTGMLPYGAPGDLPAPNSMSLLGRSVMVAPMARSVGDLWDLLGAMAGPDGLDAQAVPVELGSPDDVRAERLGCAWFANEGAYPVRPDVAATVAAAADALAVHGLAVAELRPPGLEEAEPIYAALRAADGLEDHRALAAGREGELTESIRAWFEATPPATIAEFRALAARRDQLRARVLEFMAEWPLLMLPVSGIPAFPVEARDFVVEGQAVPRFGILAPSRVVTLLGLPSASVCCGTSDEGLPIAVQVVGRPFADREVIRVAALLESHFGRWHKGLSSIVDRP
jgi:Asp-tRNA(Asn)/Glu-tRNA(Gln) amidotransferase A subunit family amidase